jgi:tetratricopeptide (TPR) repeat protein
VATGGSLAAGRIDHLDYHQPVPVVSWPARVGRVPGLASAFQDRAGLREQIQQARSRSGQVVLTQVLSGGGGMGKSQLAASYAHAALHDGTDLVVWAEAASTATVIDTFARSAVRVQAGGVSGTDAENDARAFLDWAATTTRTWLVVLDDITDPAALGCWWPVSDTGTGWVLGTTRRRDAALTGGGRAMINVETFTRDQSVAYLTERLTDAGQPRLLDASADALADVLGGLPLVLSHAASYMLDREIGCAAYLERYRAGRGRLEDLLPASADADGYGRTVAATLLLALDAADACAPAGLARPAIRLAAMLDPAGHPASVWSSAPVTAYLTGHSSSPVTAELGGEVLTLLNRYALADFDGHDSPRAVRMHALTARAARESTPADDLPAIARVAADALCAIWPDHDQTSPALAESLRANASQIAHYEGESLWHPERHPMLFQVGVSLLNARLHSAGITYWHKTAADCERLLGAEYHATLAARTSLAISYSQAGRTAEAIPIQEQVACDCERLLGAEHRNTLTALGKLAASYREAGRTAEAIPIQEQVAADFERLLGAEHPDTLTSRANLAASYGRAGRTAEAIPIEEQVAADCERLLGTDHPDTLNARDNLAASYRQAGRTTEAIAIQEQLAGREQLQRSKHS